MGLCQKIRTQIHPTTTFIIHYSVLVLPFDALAPEVTGSKYDHSMECNAYHNEVPN
jgi:hypothetical protein